MPLSQELKSGDQVEVLTSQSQMPQPQWMQFLATAKAKTRLRKALQKSRQPTVLKGKKALDAFLAENGIEESNNIVTKLLGLFHVSNLDELHYQLGSEQVILNDYVLKTLKRRSEKDSSESFLKKSCA